MSLFGVPQTLLKRNSIVACGLHPVLPDVAPMVEEEVPVCLQLGELDALVRFEAMPQVQAAVAHYLHLPFIFLAAGDELDPVVGKGEPLTIPLWEPSPSWVRSNHSSIRFERHSVAASRHLSVRN